MYNKKYRLENFEEFNEHNYIYATMLDCVCYPAYFNVGERGWFLYETDVWSVAAHRVHTSIVKDVQYTRDNKIIVTTQNTRLIFSLILGD
jgi:hypothetical protein